MLSFAHAFIGAPSLSRAKKKAPPTTYHHGDLRRALVRAAIVSINKSGNWDFSLREVARLAGVTHNAPYAHFANKQELLGAVSAAGFDSLRQRMLDASDAATCTGDKLTAIGLAYLRFGEAYPAHYRLMFGSTLGESAGNHPQEALHAARRSRAVLSDVIRQGALDGPFNIDPDDPMALVTGVLTAWSVVHGLTLLYIDGLASDETTATLLELAGRVSTLMAEGLIRR